MLDSAVDIAEPAADAILKLRDIFAPHGIQISEFEKIEPHLLTDSLELNVLVRIPRRFLERRTAKLILVADSTSAMEALRELETAKTRYPALFKEFIQIVERLGGFSELLTINTDDDTASGAGYLRVTFEPSYLFQQFLATLRALDRNRDVT